LDDIIIFVLCFENHYCFITLLDVCVNSMTVLKLPVVWALIKHGIFDWLEWLKRYRGQGHAPPVFVNSSFSLSIGFLIFFVLIKEEEEEKFSAACDILP